MIRLRLLGSPALERADGTAIRSVLAQPKRFALLAYLAAGHPPTPVRRDTLVGLLWPDLDEKHARMNLRQSLYRLRRSLGSGVLTGKRDELVSVDSERLWCDAAAFKKAVEDSRPEEATALYGGPLLEGFHLSEAREFERWLEGERRRLHLGAVAAAGRLSERSEREGDGDAARRWAARALELAPYDEAEFRRYLGLLGRQGDRATAVRVYESFARRLSADLDLQPSAETAGLVAEIRRSHDPPEAADRVEEVRGSDHTAAESRPVEEVREGRAAERAPAGSSASSRLGRRIAVVAGAFLLASLGYFGFSYLRGGGLAVGERPEIRSLAVLPLQNLSGNPGQEYFADGMTEALIGELGRLDALKVISRTSAMHYKGTDKLLPEISRELNVDALIEGSVLRAGNNVRITLQLVHGPTDRQLWSESYQGTLSNVLSLQKRVAQAVAEEIRISLESGERETLAERPRSPDPRAYEAYLKGRYHSERLGGEALLTAQSFLREAVSIDSTFAMAYAALAEVCSMPALLRKVTSVAECGAWASRAVELNDELAEAHAALGFVRMLEWQWEASEREFRRAIELNPNSVMSRQWYAELLRRTFRPEEALIEIRRAEELDPLNLFVKSMVGWVLFSQRRYDDAMAQWNEVLSMDPNYGLAIYNKGLAYWKMGRPRKVLEAARSAGRRFGDETVILRVLTAAGHALAGETELALAILATTEERFGADRPGMIAAVYLTLGCEEVALNWIETGYVQRAPWLPNTAVEPLLDGLRDHPRFRELLIKMGLTAGPGSRPFRVSVSRYGRVADRGTPAVALDNPEFCSVRQRGSNSPTTE